MFHLLDRTQLSGEAPLALSFPYHHESHPWLAQARDAVLSYLKPTLAHQPHGHLVALLLVRNAEGEIGYLSAFDQVATQDTFFVPQLFQQLPPDNPISVRFDYVESATKARIESAQALEAFKEEAAKRKAARHQARKNLLTTQQTEELARESQRDRREFSTLKALYQHSLEQESRAHARLQAESFHAERQHWVRRLKAVTLCNGAGETQTLERVLGNAVDNEAQMKAMLRTGLPALLNYAFTHKLVPLEWGCFWVGACPPEDIRYEGHFYAFPRERHAPLLNFLTRSLTIAPNPLAQDIFAAWELEIVYEDEAIVAINKPAGMLSVPGKAPIANVYDLVKARYPLATGPMLLHRLDMSTSGVLLFAKTKDVHRQLQQAFISQKIKKCYVAILEGEIEPPYGQIDVPMCLNPFERPRQMVDDAYGKAAITEFKVLCRRDGKTRIAFYPITGRSHQLRIHAAHARGLRAPIQGDELYGHPSDRLYLHAESLTFIHPLTQESITISAPAPF